MTKDAAEEFGVPDDERKHYFRSFNGKVNFAPPIDSSSWFERVNVVLDNSGRNLSIGGDDVGVVVEWSQTTIDHLTEQNIAAIKDMVRKSDWRDDIRASMWVGKAIEQVTGVHDRNTLRRLQRQLLEDKVLRIEPGEDERRHKVLYVRVVG